MAIVAGFVLSRVLGIAGERNGLAVRIAELDDSALQLDQRILTTQARLDKMDLSWFDEEATELLVESDDPQAATCDPLLEKDFGDLSEQRLRERFEALRVLTVQAYQDLSGLPNYDAYRAAAAARDLDETGEEIYKEVWRRVKPRSTFGGFASLDLDHLPTSPIVAPRGPTRAEIYSGLEKDLDHLIAERDRLVGAADVARTQLAAVQSPTGLGLGAAAFGLFLLLGVVFPLGVLATQPEKLPTLVTWTVFAAFCVGLATVSAYLTVTIRRHLK